MLSEPDSAQFACLEADTGVPGLSVPGLKEESASLLHGKCPLANRKLSRCQSESDRHRLVLTIGWGVFSAHGLLLALTTARRLRSSRTSHQQGAAFCSLICGRLICANLRPNLRTNLRPNLRW